MEVAPLVCCLYCLSSHQPPVSSQHNAHEIFILFAKIAKGEEVLVDSHTSSMHSTRWVNQAATRGTASLATEDPCQPVGVGPDTSTAMTGNRHIPHRQASEPLRELCTPQRSCMTRVHFCRSRGGAG